MRLRFRERAGVFLGLVAGLALLGLGGCSTSHYRRSADDAAYRIIEQVEGRIFGSTNAFTIETRFSGEDPKTIDPDRLIGDRMATNRRVLTLEGALDLAVANSREYQFEKETLYLTALSLTGEQHRFAPNFFADSVGRLTGTGSELDIGRVDSQIGLTQLLQTGGNLSVSLANDLLKYYSGSSSFGTEHSAINTLSVSFFQPLLRGFGRNSGAVESLTQAQRNVIYAVRSYSYFQNEFAASIVDNYFTLLERKAQVRNLYTNYIRRVELTQYFEARSVDRASANQVDDARSAELSARISYIGAVAGYLDQLDSFKLVLGVPLSDEVYLDDSALQEVAEAGPIPVGISREAAFQMAVNRHMEILNAIDQFEDSKRKVGVVADQLRPGLNLTGSANWSSDAPYDYTRFDPDEIQWQVGLELDLPIDRLNERNAYRSTLVSFERQLRSLTLTLDRYKQRIDGGLRRLEEARLNIENRQRALDVAARRVDMNSILLEAGRTQVRDLRESQDALIEAQISLTSQIVAYLQARLQVLLDMGVLVADTDRFWLNDPLAGLLSEEQKGAPPLQMPRDSLIPPDDFLEPGS